jgi:NSS family neurotransmitter:Na+ symporter
VAGAGAWALGIAALLSFNVWSDPLAFGLNTFDLLDTLTSKFMLPLTGLGAIVFAAWCLDRDSVHRELGLSGTGATLWSITARFIAPIGVIVVFVGSL